MLRQRVVTALVMLAVFLPAIFADSSTPFIALVLVLIAAAGWEWGRLNGFGPRGAVWSGVVAALACAAIWWGGWVTQPLAPYAWAWLLAGSAWVLVGAWLLYRGVGAWSSIPKGIRLLGGIVALVATWLAVAQAKHLGTNFLLSVLLLVWVADIFAYFAGRALGGKIGNGLFRGKLAPTISPGKSWAGVWGGVIGVLVLAWAWSMADLHLNADVKSLYTRLLGHGYWTLLIASLGLTAMGVVGDLVESLVKRSAGFKDSSNLLPGHGGVLDRVDALLPVLPMAMAMAAALA